MELRPYQVEPIQKGIDFFKQPNPKPSIIVAPTAAGKSIYVSSIANAIEGKTIVFQPSKELLEQNLEKLKLLGGDASVFSASMGVKEYGDITYATIGSVKNLGAKFKELGYTNLLIDEIHLYPRGVDSMLGKFLKDSGITRVLGLTATPFKLQTNSFMMIAFSKLQMLTSRSKNGSFFKEMLHVTQIQDIIKLGYWSKLEYELQEFDDSKLVFNSTKAEYTDDSIEKAYESNNIRDKIVKRLKNLEDRKSILVFVPSVADATNLSQIVPNSAVVSALTPKKERELIIKQFKNKRIKHLFNVGIFATGFDYPEIDCIILGRTTASLALVYQWIGRGTRIHPDKKDCLIIDFAGNIDRFGRVEYLYYKNDGRTWKLYGEGGKLLTGIAIDQIGIITEESENKVKISKQIIKEQPKSDKKVMPFGKFQNIEIKKLPDWYKKWLLDKFEYNSKTQFIKDELLKERQHAV